MKKFFAFMLCFGLMSGMGLGLVGCNKNEPTKVKDKATDTVKDKISDKVSDKDKITDTVKDTATKDKKDKS